MGFSRKRVGARGTTWAAVYRDATGAIRHVGTFPTKKAADKAWQRAEARRDEGRITVSRHGGMTFQTYVDEKWLPTTSSSRRRRRAIATASTATSCRSSGR